MVEKILNRMSQMYSVCLYRIFAVCICDTAYQSTSNSTLKVNQRLLNGDLEEYSRIVKRFTFHRVYFLYDVQRR